MDAETRWWEAFGGSYGTEFEKARPNYSQLDKTTQIIGALMKLELDMYNGGFLQFFCNWGYDAYLLALEGLDQIKAVKARDILQQAFAVIDAYEDDERIQELWDIGGVLTGGEAEQLDKLDHLYWQDADNIMEKMLEAFGAKS